MTPWFTGPSTLSHGATPAAKGSHFCRRKAMLPSSRKKSCRSLQTRHPCQSLAGRWAASSSAHLLRSDASQGAGAPPALTVSRMPRSDGNRTECSPACQSPGGCQGKRNDPPGTISVLPGAQLAVAILQRPSIRARGSECRGQAPQVSGCPLMATCHQLTHAGPFPASGNGRPFTMGRLGVLLSLTCWSCSNTGEGVPSPRSW